MKETPEVVSKENEPDPEIKEEKRIDKNSEMKAEKNSEVEEGKTEKPAELTEDEMGEKLKEIMSKIKKF